MVLCGCASIAGLMGLLAMAPVYGCSSNARRCLRRPLGKEGTGCPTCCHCGGADKTPFDHAYAHWAHHTAHAIPSLTQPHALFIIRATTELSKYSASKPTTTSDASLLPTHTPRGPCGNARMCTSAPHPFVLRAACSAPRVDGEPVVDTGNSEGRYGTEELAEGGRLLSSPPQKSTKPSSSSSCAPSARPPSSTCIAPAPSRTSSAHSLHSPPLDMSSSNGSGAHV